MLRKRRLHSDEDDKYISYHHLDKDITLVHNHHQVKICGVDKLLRNAKAFSCDDMARQNVSLQNEQAPLPRRVHAHADARGPHMVIAADDRFSTLMTLLNGNIPGRAIMSATDHDAHGKPSKVMYALNGYVFGRAAPVLT